MQQTNKPYEGLFITIEGGEGCGKSTLAKSLIAQLEEKGYQVIHTREPGGCQLSEKIRALLLNGDQKIPISERAELYLFLAARAQHIEELILPALREGKVVVCDRFNDSTIAYQGYARHLGSAYVEQLCSLVSEELSDPDCTLFLDLKPEEGMARIKKERSTDRLEKEHLQFHKEVRQGFLHLADQHPERICIIDASQSKQEVLENAIKALEPHLLLKPTKS